MVALILMTPIAPINSPLWEVSSSVHDNFVEQVGWHDLVATVGDIYHALPEAERAQTGILAANYGEAGAINLLGGEAGLPQSISAVNSMWLRGYGDPAPTQVIVLGYPLDVIQQYFASCSQAGLVTNAFGVENEETEHPNIWLCREPHLPWDELWPLLKHFG